MKVTLTLLHAEQVALRRFMAQFDIATPEDAAATALRDWLIGQGYLKSLEIDEDTETAGSA
ncbi:hypothetical protein ACVCNR_11165 [Aquamicrobium terrae]